MIIIIFYSLIIIFLHVYQKSMYKFGILIQQRSSLLTKINEGNI